jgi:hypothetical protein
MFTQDERGNCNVGAIKQDLQVRRGESCMVWCYIFQVGCLVDPYTSYCLDMRESTLVHGKYWSRFACITE